MKETLKKIVKGSKNKKSIKFIFIGFILTLVLFAGYIFNSSALDINKTNDSVPAANAWEPYFSTYSTVETFGTSSTNIIEKNTSKSMYGGEFYRF